MDSVSSTTNERPAASTVSSTVTQLMSRNTFEKSRTAACVLTTESHVVSAESSSAKAIFSSVVPLRCARRAFASSSSPKVAS